MTIFDPLIPSPQHRESVKYIRENEINNEIKAMNRFEELLDKYCEFHSTHQLSASDIKTDLTALLEAYDREQIAQIEVLMNRDAEALEDCYYNQAIADVLKIIKQPK